MLYLFLFACSDYGLSQLSDTGDALADVLMDTAQPADTGVTDGTISPADTSSDDTDTGESSDCVLFEFCWTSPMQADLRLEGEFQSADGTVTVPWKAWVEADDASRVCYTWTVCPGTDRFRGEGVADLDGDAVDDSWACTRTSEGDFALTGLTEFSFAGQSLEPETAADSYSDGCGVAVTLPWPD